MDTEVPVSLTVAQWQDLTAFLAFCVENGAWGLIDVPRVMEVEGLDLDGITEAITAQVPDAQTGG